VPDPIGEVVALHDAFTAWLGAGAGAFGPIEAALAPGFAMVPPDGQLHDRAAVLARLRSARGLRGAQFRIAIENAAILHAQGDMALVRYVERQWAPDSARRAVALLRWQNDAWRWLWVQETWSEPPDGQARPRVD
jgi:hypothetical protein